jgi:Flp pilus assembly protein TadB
VLLNVFLGIAAAGAAYYLAAWWSASRELRRLSYIEIRNAQIEEDLRMERRSSRRQRIEHRLANLGYEGDWTPLLVGVALIYLVIAVVLSFFGFGDAIGAVLALPIAIVGAVAALANTRRKRYAKFEQQLLKVLSSVAGHLEAGDTPPMAFQKAARLAENPMRTELQTALATQLGTETLSQTIGQLSTRYPSRAMTLLVAALSIDDRVGAQLSPALRQAQSTLERQFELSAEATAEISQARGEFFAISGVMATIGFALIAGSGGTAREAYASFMGIAVLALALANYGVGVWRALRIFRRAASGR